jgi:hypothetical protein
VRGGLRTLFFATAALGAAVVLFVALTLPPASVNLGARLPATYATGAYHVHSSRSDGTGTPDEIAAAASRAGLSFVIITDHGDGTRTPDPPRYHDGVLVIDAVEINTASGHIVALGLSDAAPYPLAGTAADVIEDIHRLGGWAVVAHPDSPKDSLRWRGSAGAQFDGIEWLNADAEWRDETARRLITTAARAVFRGPESVALLFRSPARTFARWDQASRFRSAPVFGLAALDAHANIPWREDDEPRQHTALERPAYETMFRTLVQTVVLDAPLSGDAPADARSLLRAITTGRSFSVTRAFAYPAALTFTAETGGRTLTMGESTPEAGSPATFRGAVERAPGARISVFRNGQPMGSGTGAVEVREEAAGGVYRVQAEWPGQSAPWLVSNQIVIGTPPAGPSPESSPAEPAGWIDLRAEGHPWSTDEHSQDSTGTLTIDGGAMRFDYRLGSGTPSGQFAALTGLVGGNAGIDRVMFTARADRPTRVSLQVKLPRGNAIRWRRSVFLDRTERTFTVGLPEFEPADVVTTSRPNVTPLQSVLFVVDTLNSATGSSGTLWISRVSLGTANP